MSPTYASETKVSVENSRKEIERTLDRYGAEAFGYSYDGARATIVFRAHARHVRFDLVVPDRDDFKRTPTGLYRHDAATIDRAWEQAQRQRWRALALVVKAKLEAVEAGIVTFEQEFLAHIMLPDGTTTYDWMRPQLAEVYESGDMPAVLPPARALLEAGGV